jgi:hypothetical protein
MMRRYINVSHWLFVVYAVYCLVTEKFQTKPDGQDNAFNLSAVIQEQVLAITASLKESLTAVNLLDTAEKVSAAVSACRTLGLKLKVNVRDVLL